MVYGVKGGANFASYIINFESALSYKYKLGYQIGGFAKIKLTDKLYLQPELLYVLQGTKFDLNLVSITLPQSLPDDSLFDNNSSGKENQSNIILPITIQYFLSEKFRVSFGPQMDYLFYVTYDGLETITSGGINNIAKDSYSANEFNLGLNLGVGYDLDEKMGLELRYNYGFNRLFKGDLSNFDNGYTLRNSVFQLNFEYRFN